MRFALIMRRRLALLTIAIFVLAGGVAYATGTLTSSGSVAAVIQACQKNENGDLRVVAGAADCKNNETPISWNAAGPQGPPGKDGADGKNGVDGAPGAPCLPVDPACRGPEGATGATGAAGPPGTPGVPGKDGVNGESGLSCLPSNPLCVGPKGDKGDPGPQGTAGSGGTLVSLDSLNGVACNTAGVAGTIRVTYGPAPDGTVTLACRPTATLTLTVTKSGTGTGTVLSDLGGIACGATCSDVFTLGTVVRLTAIASAADIFTGWSGACTGVGVCTVTVDAAKTVTADFSPAATLTVVQSGGFCYTFDGIGCTSATSGPIDVQLFNAADLQFETVSTCSFFWPTSSSTCLRRFAVGTVVTLSAQDANGLPVWGGACTGAAVIDPYDCKITMTGDKSVTATYPTQ